MKDMPQVATNGEGLELLREMAQESREVRKEIGELREAMAEQRGANLPGVVAALSARVATLEAKVLEITVAARPGQYAVKELAKHAIGAIFAALVALAALGKLPTS